MAGTRVHTDYGFGVELVESSGYVHIGVNYTNGAARKSVSWKNDEESLRGYFAGYTHSGERQSSMISHLLDRAEKLRNTETRNLAATALVALWATKEVFVSESLVSQGSDFWESEMILLTVCTVTGISSSELAGVQVGESANPGAVGSNIAGVVETFARGLTERVPEEERDLPEVGLLSSSNNLQRVRQGSLEATWGTETYSGELRTVFGMERVFGSKTKRIQKIVSDHVSVFTPSPKEIYKVLRSQSAFQTRKQETDFQNLMLGAQHLQGRFLRRANIAMEFTELLVDLNTGDFNQTITGSGKWTAGALILAAGIDGIQGMNLPYLTKMMYENPKPYNVIAGAVNCISPN